MATVTLHPSTPIASPKATPTELAPFWSSLYQASADFGATPNREPAQAEKSSAVVGDLWIQIR